MSLKKVKLIIRSLTHNNFNDYNKAGWPPFYLIIMQYIKLSAQEIYILSCSSFPVLMESVTAEKGINTVTQLSHLNKIHGFSFAFVQTIYYRSFDYFSSF